MTPVEVHPSAARKMSSEEYRLTQLMSSELEGESAQQDSATTYVLESRASDPNISASEDSSPDAKPAALPDCVAATDNTNSNNNNSQNSSVFVTTTSLYIGGGFRDTQSSDSVAPERSRRRSSEAETTRSSTNSDTNISNSEPATPCHPKDPTF